MILRSILLSLAVVVGFPTVGLSQQDAPAWRWSWDGNVFFGHNYQARRFVDVSAWESQTWGMLAAERPVRSTDRFSVMAMVSVEAFTVDGQGSPQLFQTGESYSHLLPRLPVALGAAITLYHIPTDLESYYEPSRSFHVFIHWRPRTAHAPTHVH
jgi:hypothetical protein